MGMAVIPHVLLCHPHTPFTFLLPVEPNDTGHEWHDISLMIHDFTI